MTKRINAMGSAADYRIIGSSRCHGLADVRGQIWIQYESAGCGKVISALRLPTETGIDGSSFENS